MTTDPTVHELEQTARQGFHSEGRGFVFYLHSLDGTSQMFYQSLGQLQSNPLPGISDDPEIAKGLQSYDTAREYIVIEFIEEANGTTVPTWYLLKYIGAAPALSA